MHVIDGKVADPSDAIDPDVVAAITKAIDG